MQMPKYSRPSAETRKAEGTAQNGLAAQISPSFGARMRARAAAS